MTCLNKDLTNSNKYVIIETPSKQLYAKCIDGNTLNGNLDSNLNYSEYWHRPDYKDEYRHSEANIDIGTPSFTYGSVINGEHLVISSFSTKRINNNYNYILEIACGDDVIICHYDVARIQKITPLIWNEEFRSYEVSN